MSKFRFEAAKHWQEILFERRVIDDPDLRPAFTPDGSELNQASTFFLAWSLAMLKLLSPPVDYVEIINRNGAIQFQ